MILVTGGEGYLGGRIVCHLVDNQFKVRVGGRVDKEGVVKIDFSDQKSLENACKGVDCIIHLAAMNASDCEKNPNQALEINGLGTMKLINAAIKEGTTKFIYFSSSQVYGKSLVGMVDEETLPRPENHYSITHRTAEDYLLLESDKGTISGTVLRVTNAVGFPKNQSSNCWMLFVNNICKQIVTTNKIKILSDPFLKRDFIPISSICSLMPFLIRNDLSKEVFNISSGHLISLNEMAVFVQKIALAVLNVAPEIVYNGNFKNHKNNSMSISNKKLNNFGFDIEVDLSEEIEGLLLDCQKWFGLMK